MNSPGANWILWSIPAWLSGLMGSGEVTGTGSWRPLCIHPFLAGSVALNCFLMRVSRTESRTNGPDFGKQVV